MRCNILHFSLSLLLASTAPLQARAQSTTRAQVKAEAQQAVQAGQVPVGELGKTRSELKGESSKQTMPTEGKTRAEVKAEALAAQRAGDVQVGDLGKTQAEKDPPRYAGAPSKPPKLKLRTHRNAPAASAPAE